MCNSTQTLTLCRHFNVILGYSNRYLHLQQRRKQQNCNSLRPTFQLNWCMEVCWSALYVANCENSSHLSRQYRRKHQQIFMLQWIYILPTFAAMSCQGPVLPVVLRRCGERREWGMQSLQFFQDNAACFPLTPHEILCSLCLFIFTIPITHN